MVMIMDWIHFILGSAIGGLIGSLAYLAVERVAI